MKQKHTLIVGGTSGSGLYLAEKLARNNHNVSVIGLNPSKSLRNVKNISFFDQDLTKEKQIKPLCEKIIDKNGTLDNLIFYQRYRGKEDDWQCEIQTSLTATKIIIETLSEHFINNSNKSIVLISSKAREFIAYEQPISYHVAKAGIYQITRYYAYKLGSNGIRVNAVCPGAVLKSANKEFYSDNKDLIKMYEQITPLKRMGTSEDIANAVIFLCSDKASFITGQEIVVDGGLSLCWQESLARKLAFSNKKLNNKEKK